MRISGRTVTIAFLALLAGCSLLVDADKERLGALENESDGHSVGDGSAGPCSVDADCDDGNGCNGVERCLPGDVSADSASGCAAGEAPSCDDGIDCTVDGCDPVGGCSHDAESTRCADGVACTVDICDDELGCRNEPSDARCDFCTTGATCDATADCQGGLVENDCFDGDDCTVDRCDVATAQCQHENSCEAGPDNCGNVELVDLVEGHAVVSGAFNRVTSTYDTRCGDPGAPDAIYRLHVEEVSDIVLDASLSRADVILAVATTCSDDGFDLACADLDGVRGVGARLVVHRFDPAVQGSELFVLVDGSSRQETDGYVVTVDVTPVADDRCEGTPLALAGAATVLGFMDAREPPQAWGVSEGSCQVQGDGQKAPEALVRVAGADDGTLSLEVQSDAFAPVLYARNRCSGGGRNEELGCATALVPQVSDRTELEVELAADDEAFVFVDGGEDRAPYVLRVRP